MVTNVYIDGFNLYNGSLKNTAYKWLDLEALCATLLPGHVINKIRYVTARIKPFPHDPQAPGRQDRYLQALHTLPQVIVHADGRFVANNLVLPQYPFANRGPNHRPLLVQVRKMEEKRADVDIASHLLLACFNEDFDDAVVISNDSDLVPHIEMVSWQFNKKIGVINPHPPSGMSGHLILPASYHYRTINKSVLASSPLPPSVTNASGRTITKPSSW